MSKFASLLLEVDKPERMTLVHPITKQPLRDEAGTEAFISLYSADSEVARKHQRTVGKRRLAMRRGAKPTIEEIEAEQVELLAVLTADWYLLGWRDSQPLSEPFSLENARELYGLAGATWIREQVDDWLGDRANFVKASSQT